MLFMNICEMLPGGLSSLHTRISWNNCNSTTCLKVVNQLNPLHPIDILHQLKVCALACDVELMRHAERKGVVFFYMS